MEYDIDKTADFARCCPRCRKLQFGSLMAGPGSEAYWHADLSRDDCEIVECSDKRTIEYLTEQLAEKAAEIKQLDWMFDSICKDYSKTEEGKAAAASSRKVIEDAVERFHRSQTRPMKESE